MTSQASPKQAPAQRGGAGLAELVGLCLGGPLQGAPTEPQEMVVHWA